MPPPLPIDAWTVVVPVKELRLAKSRLAHLEPAARADLSLAMAADVISAALATPTVGAVVVVTNDGRAASALGEMGARVVADDEDAGIDAALRSAARTALALWPRYGVAAVSADLPCLDAATLDDALARAAGHSRSVLADARGTGTTVLTARPGEPLDPRYGDGSLARHRLAGAAELDPTGLDRARLDVDTLADLDAALALGVGPHTAGMLAVPRRPAER